MRIIAGIPFLAVLMWLGPASAQKTYSLSVSQHREVPALSENEVEQILARASKMLQKDSRHNTDDDVACNVAFTLRGPVRTFGSPDTPAVVDKDHIDAVNRVDDDVAGVNFHVKIVREIKFCRDRSAEFNGCSFSPNAHFRSIIVVDPKLHEQADHLTWAHEFGHLTGLPHRLGDGPDWAPLMTPCSIGNSKLPDSRVLVNRAECRSLLSGPGKKAATVVVNCPTNP